MRAVARKLRLFLENLPLQPTVAVVLILGLSVPATLAAWRNVEQRREALLTNIADDHARIVQVLAIGMQTPIWEVRPDAGKPLLETLMRDERIAAIRVESPFMPEFLVATAAERRNGDPLILGGPVTRQGRPIGWVEVEMSTGALDAELGQRWAQVLITALFQLGVGMLLLFPILRLKVLDPLERLVGQSKALAQGALDRPLAWSRRDEIGVLGRSLEDGRKALKALVSNMEARNTELHDRQDDLDRRRRLLREILDNLNDGVTLFDKDLRLKRWNDRFLRIMDLPAEFVRRGMHVEDLVAYDLERGRHQPANREALKARVRASFREGEAQNLNYVMADGQQILVRRRPMPGGGFVSTYTDVTEQVEARRKADETLHLLELVMDAVPGVLHVKDRDLRYRLVNRTFPQWWGASRDAVIGRTNREIFPPDLLKGPDGFAFSKAEERERRVLETGQEIPFYEGTRPQGDGEPITTWTTKVPLLDADGQVTHILTVDFDISDRKRMEQEHQRWVRLFRDAIESLPNGFAIYDASLNLVACNTAFASLYGEKPDSMIGTHVSALIPRFIDQVITFDGLSGDDIEPALRRSLDPRWAGTGNPIEVHLDDGCWVLATRHKTDEGGLVWLRTDITELKRMQQDLSDSERRFRVIAETHPVPSVMVSAHSVRFLYASPGFASLVGQPASKLAGTRASTVFTDPRNLSRLIRRMRRSGAITGREVTLRRWDGSTVEASVTAKPVTYQGESAVLASVFDLTERKRAETEIRRHREALHQSEKMGALGTLLAGVAHELNNPLSVVVGRSIMLEERFGQSQAAESVRRLRDAAERCARIVRTFLALARQQEPSRSWVDLPAVIRGAVELVDYGLRTSGIEVRLDLPDDMPRLFADSDQLTQVFVNLFVNAQQAMEDAPPPRCLTVSVHVDALADTVRIVVADTGPGIPEDVLPRIFEPFFTTKRMGEGTGLGLSVSDGIIKSHGGTITAERGPEGGLSINVVLPIGQVTGTDDADVQAVPNLAPPATVLIVDDEPEVAQTLGDMLIAEGHHVVFADSGHSALQQIGARRFDVVISDLRMAGLDGAGLFREIQSTRPGLVDRMIFVTGDTLGPTARRFLDEAERPVIEKPFAPTEVLRVVGSVLHPSRT